MNKDKWNERWNRWKVHLDFLKPWDDEDDENYEDDWDEGDLDVRQISVSDASGRLRGGWYDPRKRKAYCAAAVAGLVFLVIFGFSYYNGHHLFQDYVVTHTSESLDIVGTRYQKLGDSIVKYSPDGIFCVSSRNEAKWSAAYSMQAPVVDVCEETMVIAEQQGTQVYVLNEKGLLGNFKTSLPILKTHVSAQGVVALVLGDGEVTWINLYSATGEEIVSVRTTVKDSGYPLDIALTPNASKMMVSYLGVSQGTLSSRIAFYDFSSAGSVEGHLTGTLDYGGRVFPEVYYADASTPVALSDNGFVVFRSGDEPVERKSVTFETEIVSSFHDKDYVGFVFENEAEDCQYRMELYQYGGKKVMDADFDGEYTEVKMDRGEILLYDAKYCTVFTASGTRRFTSDYEKQVAYFARLPGFRKYLVVTNDSMDHIRIS